MDSNESQTLSEYLLSLLLIVLSLALILILFPISLLFCFEIILDFQKIIVFRLGRIRLGVNGPGIVIILPCIDSYRLLDLREISFLIPKQSLITRDSISCEVEAVLYYRIINAREAVTNVSDYCRATRLLAQTVLIAVFGRKILSEILSESEQISHQMKQILTQITVEWGVIVERVDVISVTIPSNLMRKMAAEAEALRESRAKVINAEGEKSASLALASASDIIGDGIGLHLRYLHSLSSLKGENNETVVFPIPIDFFQHLYE